MYRNTCGALRSRHAKLMMYSIADLEKATGFTTNQVRDRLQLLSPLFVGGLRKGSRGKILVTDGVLAALRRMREIESQGLAPRVAQTEIMKELGSAYKDGATAFGEGLTREPPGGPGETELVQALRERIAEQGKEIAWLRSRLDQLAPLALPQPRGILRWLWPSRARSVQGRTAGSR